MAVIRLIKESKQLLQESVCVCAEYAKADWSQTGRKCYKYKDVLHGISIAGLNNSPKIIICLTAPLSGIYDTLDNLFNMAVALEVSYLESMQPPQQQTNSSTHSIQTHAAKVLSQAISHLSLSRHTSPVVILANLG